MGETLKKEVSVERGEEREEGEKTKVEKDGESQGGVKAFSWLGVEQERGCRESSLFSDAETAVRWFSASPWACLWLQAG